MKEQQIDLMPQAIRERSQAGVRAGQYALGYLLVIVFVVLLTTHARLSLSNAQNQHETARKNADSVLRTERKTEELRTIIHDLQQYVDQYEQVSYPVNTSRVIATVVHVLPPSVSLDRVDIDTGEKRAVRTPRSRGEDDDQPKAHRWMTVELGGFAASDEDIAELVGRLQNLDGFQTVSLDFSRTRAVNDNPARAFRLSFRIDLDASYEIAGLSFSDPIDGGSP